jgi:hypothetical protein
MSSFKAQSRLLGLADGGSDDDESGDDEVQHGPAESEEDVDEGSSDESESEEDAPEDGADGGGEESAPTKMSSKELRAARKREAAWLQAHFITVSRSERGATVYKTELLPDKIFFSREKLEEFTRGKRYKRLMHEMRKGMRTHAENEKLRLKAEARRERVHARRQEKRREKVEKRRAIPDANDDDEIARRKALFQEKKARRLARKAAAAAGAS